MDLFRRSHDSEVFEALVELRRAALLRRIRSRLRQLGAVLEAEDVLQDVLVNVYRYPDRFDGSRPGAFRAWSTTIVDNSIRRRLRRRRSGPEILLQSSEDLSREPDSRAVEPADRAADGEEAREAAAVLGLLLRAYLQAFAELNERERFVLQMVEVQGLRYAEVAEVLGVRPEALKMVVFRARRRIQDKLSVMFSRACAGPDHAAA
jgi:RNA polymerase sigma-70 factor (ECF subfamily)